MIFKTPEELVEFFNKLDLDKSTLVFKENESECGKQSDCKCVTDKDGKCTCEKEIPESNYIIISDTNEILVESLSDSPSFELELIEEGDNVFYVKDFKAAPNSCGTGQIDLEDRTAYMNMCEMENKATVELNVVIKGNRLNNVKFTLKKTEDQSRLTINKLLLV